MLLDSGLFTDPIVQYPPDLTVEIPQWRGVGANALRTDTAPRYTSLGEPVATTDEGLWALVCRQRCAACPSTLWQI